MKLNIKEHLKAISPSIILLLGYGTQLVWALNEFQTPEIKFVIYYFGGLLGAILGAGLISTVKKSVIYNIAAVLTLIVGILFAISGFHASLPCVIIGRFVAGTCHSMTLLTALIHASEIASHENVRHKVITVLGICLGVSVALPAAIFTLPVNAEIIVGVICLIQAVSVFLTNIYNTKESPHFLLQKSNDGLEEASNEAFEVYNMFHGGLTQNADISTGFSHLKSYVMEEKNASRNIFNAQNLKALLLCIIVRLISLITFNFANVYFIINFVSSLLESKEFGILTTGSVYFIWGLIVMLAFCKSRHVLYLIATVVIFVLLFFFPIAILIETLFHIPVFNLLSWLIAPIIYVLSFSLPLEVNGLINLSEAFSLSKKAYSISFVLIIENIIHILISPMNVLMSLYEWVLACLIIFCLIVFFKIPRNTNNLMLEKCPAVYKAARVRTGDNLSLISLSERAPPQ